VYVLNSIVPRLSSQLEAANQLHSVLCQHLRRPAGKVSLHTILLGVVEPNAAHNGWSLQDSWSESYQACLKLHAYSDQYAYKLASVLKKTFASSHYQGPKLMYSSTLYALFTCSVNLWPPSLVIDVVPCRPLVWLE